MYTTRNDLHSLLDIYFNPVLTVDLPLASMAHVGVSFSPHMRPVPPVEDKSMMLASGPLERKHMNRKRLILPPGEDLQTRTRRVAALSSSRHARTRQKSLSNPVLVSGAKADRWLFANTMCPCRLTMNFGKLMLVYNANPKHRLLDHASTNSMASGSPSGSAFPQDYPDSSLAVDSPGTSVPWRRIWPVAAPS